MEYPNSFSLKNFLSYLPTLLEHGLGGKSPIFSAESLLERLPSREVKPFLPHLNSSQSIPELKDNVQPNENKQIISQNHNPLCSSFSVLVRLSEQSKPCKSQLRSQGWAGWRSNTPTGAPKHSRVVWGDSKGKGLQVQPNSGSSGDKSLYKPLLPLCHLHKLYKSISSTVKGSTPHPSYSNCSFCINGKLPADTFAN